MSGFRFSILGLCFALSACGDKFVAHTGSAGSGGTSDAGSAGTGAGAGSGGGAGEAGSSGSNDNAGADAGEGDAGSDTGGGGGGANGGAGGTLGNPSGGASGSAGSGGKVIDPSLPRDGLLVWLRADHGVHEKDGGVQTWDDQSDNTLNATQQTANARPVYLPTGFNGRPTLQFDGEGQFLAFTAGFGDFSKGFAGL
ncbi:MAG TPA: hypothetical protein VHM25_22930, partial [Polyangiaceae bacterium]|nr:hypothetical protein [Polyangiaceae bacterium]